MRCLALAQAWQDAGGKAVLASVDLLPSVRERLLSEGVEVVSLESAPGSADDARCATELANRYAAAWVVVDGYHFLADYQQKLKTAGLRVLFLDDNGHADHYAADLVLNQNVHADESYYRSREPYTRLLLGTRYVLLRREFRSWSNWKREIAPVGRRVLVSMGGSDPRNVTASVMQALRSIAVDGLEVAVVAGGSNPHLGSLERTVESYDGGFRLLKNVLNMPELMAWADVAVAAAGTTFWEICALGLPSILVALAKNQRSIAERATQLGAAENLGDSSSVTATMIANALQKLLGSPEEREIRSQCARRLVDGRGSQRVLTFLSDLKLRRANDGDCQLFWDWANDPGTRASSFTSKTISWEEHVAWFRSKLADPQAILYTATNGEGTPLGEVRFQLRQDAATLSISLGKEFRGHGWGRRILEGAIHQLFHDYHVQFIDAYVKPENEASLRLFAGSGFKRMGSETIEGQQAVHFVLRRGA